MLNQMLLKLHINELLLLVNLNVKMHPLLLLHLRDVLKLFQQLLMLEHQQRQKVALSGQQVLRELLHGKVPQQGVQHCWVQRIHRHLLFSVQCRLNPLFLTIKLPININDYVSNINQPPYKLGQPIHQKLHLHPFQHQNLNLYAIIRYEATYIIHANNVIPHQGVLIV